MPEDQGAALAELTRDGLVSVAAGEVRTTRRWQAAMARAALRLSRDGVDLADLRLPIAAAMVELYPDAANEELARRVEAMLPVETRALFPGLTSPHGAT
jgi:hypothetical protein